MGLVFTKGAPFPLCTVPLVCVLMVGMVLASHQEGSIVARTFHHYLDLQTAKVSEIERVLRVLDTQMKDLRGTLNGEYATIRTADYFSDIDRVNFQVRLAASQAFLSNQWMNRQIHPLKDLGYSAQFILKTLNLIRSGLIQELNRVSEKNRLDPITDDVLRQIQDSMKKSIELWWFDDTISSAFKDPEVDMAPSHPNHHSPQESFQDHEAPQRILLDWIDGLVQHIKSYVPVRPTTKCLSLCIHELFPILWTNLGGENGQFGE